MKKLCFALAAAGSLALVACGGPEEDSLPENLSDNLQADELNALADDAAQDAANEMEMLENQQQELQAEPVAEETTTTSDAGAGVTTEPSEVEDEPLGL